MLNTPSNDEDTKLADVAAVIHSSAVIDPTATLGEGVEVGPFAYIGAGVILGRGVKVGHGATVEGPTRVGDETQIWPQAAVGLAPQDLKYSGEETRLEIGTNCRIREFASLHRGTQGGGGVTRIGNEVLIMNGAHVGHDCQIGNHCIIAAHSALGGHVEMGDHAILGGVSGLHQFVRVGAHAMVGAGLVVTQDVPTYAMVMGSEGRLAGANVTGLKRRGFEREQIRRISQVMRDVFGAGEQSNFADKLAAAKDAYSQDPALRALFDFIEGAGENNRSRGFVRGS